MKTSVVLVRTGLFIAAQVVFLVACPGNGIACPVSRNTKFFWRPYESYMQTDSRGQMFGKLPLFIQEAMGICCPEIPPPNYTEIPRNDSKSIEIFIRKDRHSKYLTMYFPVFGNRDRTSRYDRPFVSLFDSPGLVVFVPEANQETENGFLVVVATQLWQLFALCFLLAAIAGILVWFLDRKANNGNFPDDFRQGAFAGLWWAFVTMSTVGYGDIVPRSFLSRSVAVLWMIIGYLTLTMFNASLTALITSKEMPGEVNLVGRKIYIPRGGKAFLEEELNLIADYQEIEYKDFGRMIREKKDATLMSYNYADVKLAQEFANTMKGQKNTIKIIKNVNYRFSIGIGISGNLTNSAPFIGCFGRELRDRVVLDKHNTYELLRRLVSKSVHQSTSSSPPARYKWTGWLIGIVTAGALLTFMIVIGILNQMCRWNKHRPQGNTSHSLEYQMANRNDLSNNHRAKTTGT